MSEAIERRGEIVEGDYIVDPYRLGTSKQLAQNDVMAVMGVAFGVALAVFLIGSLWPGPTIDLIARWLLPIGGAVGLGGLLLTMWRLRR